MSSSYDSSEEEFDMEEEEDLAMILAMHINKKPKHGGSVMGRQKNWRDRIDAHNGLRGTILWRIPHTRSRTFVAGLG